MSANVIQLKRPIIEVADLGLRPLDYWVIKSLGHLIVTDQGSEPMYRQVSMLGHLSKLVERIPLYSIDVNVAFGIMEAHEIQYVYLDQGKRCAWLKANKSGTMQLGYSVLEACMRAFVTSKFGMTVEDLY